jgi:hypothetical protein
MAAERPRRVEVRPFPSNRRLVTAAMRAGRRTMPMYGLVDVDVTAANRLLASHDPPCSLTAFVVASVARPPPPARSPCLRNWRGQLVTHHHVDVGTMVEISTPQGPFAIPHLLRDADIRRCPGSRPSCRVSASHRRAAAAGGWNEPRRPRPGSGHGSGNVCRDGQSVTARQRIGTVAVTAVGMFVNGGLGITSLTLMSLEVIVGGMTQRPRIVDSQVAIGTYWISLWRSTTTWWTGRPRPLRRRVRELLESAAVITPSS